MGALIRTYDWRNTSVGPLDQWPQSLRTVLRLMLASQHPMLVFWGPDLIQFYNDAFAPSLGVARHPTDLGQPARQCWQDAWPVIGAQIEQVIAGDGAVWHDHALVPIMRDGQLVDVYWTYSYNPIDDPSAAHGVGGVLVICEEVTQEVEALQ
jgi:hypothetical protein